MGFINSELYIPFEIRNDFTDEIVSDGDIVTSLTPSEALTLIYVGYYGRAPDAPGFLYWKNRLDIHVEDATFDTNNIRSPLTEIANTFSGELETTTLYPSLGNINPDFTLPLARIQLGLFLDNVYQNLFNRAPEAAGKSFWFDAISSGSVGFGEAILAIADGARGTDKDAVLGKVAAAGYFMKWAATYEVGAAQEEYLEGARNAVSVVSSEPETLALSISKTDEWIEKQEVYIKPVLLPESALSYEGGPLDDTVGVTEIPANFSASGAAGYDQLFILPGTTGGTVVPIISGFETINDFNLNYAIDFSNISGLQAFHSFGSGGDIAYSNLSFEEAFSFNFDTLSPSTHYSLTGNPSVGGTEQFVELSAVYTDSFWDITMNTHGISHLTLPMIVLGGPSGTRDNTLSQFSETDTTRQQAIDYAKFIFNAPEFDYTYLTVEHPTTETLYVFFDQGENGTIDATMALQGFLPFRSSALDPSFINAQSPWEEFVYGIHDAPILGVEYDDAIKIHLALDALPSFDFG